MDQGAPTQTGLGQGKLVYTTEVITPAIAREFIDTLRGSHPPLDQATVAKYKAAMLQGGWVLNGLPIILDENNRLVDGYHRLMACIEGKVEFKTLVARGARADILHTIDQHRRRSYATVLESRGIKNAGEVHRTLNRLIKIDNGIFLKSNQPASWERLDIVLDANPEILRANDIVGEIGISHIPTRGQLALSIMALKAGHEDKLYEFIAKLDSDGRDLRMNDPVAVLLSTYESLIGNSPNGLLDPDQGLALGVLAFNDFVSGSEPPRAYGWRPDYGVKPTERDGIPTLKQRQNAPENCGFPTVLGYRGLQNSHILDTTNEIEEAGLFQGQTADSLVAAAKGDADVSVRHLLVTPQIALRWLEKYNTVNRKIQKVHIERIARDIRNGNWMLNAQPIAFVGDPMHPESGPVRLINGQHRLRACVMANTPIELSIAINIPEAAFATFDVHAKRAKGRHAGDVRVASSAAVLQWREDNKLDLKDKQRPTSTEIEFTMKKHPQLEEYAGEIRRAKGLGSVDKVGRADKIATGAVMVYLIHRVMRENPVLGRQFIDGLRGGIGIEPGNPILRLRDQALKSRAGANRLNRYDALDFLLEGWERYKAYIAKLSKPNKSMKQQADVSREDLLAINEEDAEAFDFDGDYYTEIEDEAQDSKNPEPKLLDL